MPEDKEDSPRRKPGRPPRQLGQWGIGEHEAFMAIYRAFHIGFNKRDRGEVDEHAEKLIAYVNKARGL